MSLMEVWRASYRQVLRFDLSDEVLFEKLVDCRILLQSRCSPGFRNLVRKPPRFVSIPVILKRHVDVL